VRAYLPRKVHDLSDAELFEDASAYYVYEDTFWAWEETNRIVEQEGPDAAWSLILQLMEKGPDRALGAVVVIRGPAENASAGYESVAAKQMTPRTMHSAPATRLQPMRSLSNRLPK
jgi:hypothetical protein